MSSTNNAERIEQLEIQRKRLIIQKLELQKKELLERNKIYKSARDYKGLYLVMIGGSGSGKSYEAADKMIDRLVFETKETIGQNHRILCVRAQRNQVTASQFPLLKSRALMRYPLKDGYEWEVLRGQGNEAIRIGDNEIIFAGLDDVDRLRSIFDITSIWIEEADQVRQEDFWELDRRLRVGKNFKSYMQIIMTFNPTSITSWLNEEFFKSRTDRTAVMRGDAPFEDFPHWKDYGLDSSKKHTYIHEKSKKEITEHYYNMMIVHSTYLDNQFIDVGYYEKMERQKERDINEYNIYALGQWGLVGGIYFNATNINERRIIMEKFIADNGITRGEFQYQYKSHMIVESSIEWVDDPFGCIRIYEEPSTNTPYVIGADTSGEGSDFNAAVCTNNISGADVATVHLAIDEDLFARQLYCLGKYFGLRSHCANNALIGIETNFSTHPQKEIQRLGYDHLYVREESQDKFSGNIVQRFGFNTNTSTRPHALQMLRAVVRDDPQKIRDVVFLSEAQTFVKNEKGKPVAMNGQHDDMVMARAINCYIAHQQDRTHQEAYMNIDIESQLPEDYVEDYNRCSDSKKDALISEWVRQGIIK